MRPISAQYDDASLSVGNKALLKAYPDTYMMKVYPAITAPPTHSGFYDATQSTTATATMSDQRQRCHHSIAGVPFPIPDDGTQVF